MASTDTRSNVTDRFLDAIRNARVHVVDDLYSPDADLDATVPNWRFTVSGGECIRAEYGRWFNEPCDITELVRHSTTTGEVIEYSITWDEGGVLYGGHHVHVLTIDESADLITHDRVWCGGRWPESLMADMDVARVDAQG
ncbi:MAG: hypothetical protein ABIW84_01430 [Ilumatobacteraceae bacterium]